MTQANVKVLRRVSIAAVLISFVISSVPAGARRSDLPAPHQNSQDVVQQNQPQITADEVEKLRQSIRRLSAEVAQLTRRVESIERERTLEVTRVLLQGEEQRAELLQAKISATYEKQLVLGVRLEQLDQQMRPENIEKLFIGVGSTRPEESREAVRRRLASERQGIALLLEALRQERARLQSSLSSADVATHRLRGRLAAAAR